MSTIRKNIVFIDNTNENWVGDMNIHAKTVDYIRVPNTSQNHEPTYTKDLAKTGNQYAIRIRKSGTSNFVNKGFDHKIANQLKKWSRIPTHSPKYALFDWDGTISATEGFSLDVFDTIPNDLRIPSACTPKIKFTSPMMSFLLPNMRGGTKSVRKKSRKTKKHHHRQNMTLQEMLDSQEYQHDSMRPLVMPSKEFLDDMFVYLMRPERVKMLRDLFRTLLSNGVRVHIFTHNPYASTANSYRQIFIEMMWRLFNQRYVPFNQNSENQYSREYKDRKGNLVKIVESSSHLVSLISKEELDSMLHSTMDYTNEGEPFLKHNMMRVIGLDATI